MGWCRYVTGTWPTLRGIETGSLPPGFAAPVSTSAMASGPASPGTHASRIAPQWAAAHSMASGRPLTTTSTTGVPVATTASSSSCWRPWNPRVERSRNSPVVESSVSPDRSPRTTIATSRPASDLDRGRDVRVGPVGDPGPARVDDLGAGQGGADGIEDRPTPGQLVAGLDDLALADDAERVLAGPHLPQRLHVDEVAVVAEQVTGAVGDRSDHGDPTVAPVERQQAIVLDQHQ